MDETFLILADGVVTMAGETGYFVERAGVAVEGGKIAAVGKADELRKNYGGVREEYVPGVMVPGLINMHTHLELGYQRERAKERPGYFTEWVGALMRNYPAAEKVEQMVLRAVRAGVKESLEAGVTTLGDISRHCALTRSVLTNGPLRVFSFGEVIGLGKMRDRREEFLRIAADRGFASEHLHVALSPHAPYTVETLTLQMVVQVAAAQNLPVTMHLGELAEERAFLGSHSGKLAEWPVMRNILDQGVPTYGDGPVEWAAACGLLGERGVAKKVPVVLAHVNYCDDEEMGILTQSGATVIYCPRTHEYFGHSRHRYREMLDAGVNVALGTDSLASNPDLSILKEAALLCRRDQLPPYRAFELITTNAARTLGINGGALEVNRFADIAVFPIRVVSTVEEMLSALLTESPSASAVWIGGRQAI